MVRRLHHGVVVRVAGPGDRPRDPEVGRIASISALQNSGPRSEWDASIDIEGKLDVRERGLDQRGILAPAA